MDLKAELTSYAALTEKEIATYIDKKPDYLYVPLRDLFSRGGKRVRPGFCMAACEAVGGKREDALKTAAFIEMVHNFTLIHDDIADKSELRRGKPCLHHKYGLGTAINCGDGLFAKSYEVLSDAVDRMETAKGLRVFKILSSYITGVCEGQSMDIGWAEGKFWDIDEQDYMEMIKRKTGMLMSASCEAGAIIGGGSEEEIAALRNYGMNLGMGFQIHDDVLNLQGDVAEYGKEIGGDINEGKRTLMIIYTLSVCTKAEKSRLIEILDKEKNNQSEIKEAIDLLIKYDSINRAANIAKKYIEKGKKDLKVIPESEKKDLFLDFANYMIERKN